MYSKSCQTSKMQCFGKKDNGQKSLFSQSGLYDLISGEKILKTLSFKKNLI